MVLKILVIGLGSMGKRRIRLLKAINSSIVVYGVDKDNERCIQVSNEYKIKTYTNLSDVLYGMDIKPDAAIISTSPLSHAVIIGECLAAAV